MFPRKHSSWRASLGVLLGALLLPQFAAAQSTFTHVHLRVPDTAAAAAWYQELLGGELREGGPGPSIRFANGFIGTMPNEGTAAPSRGGVIDHFAIAVADVDAALARAQRLGATVAVEPQAGGDPAAAIIEDPWGTRVELIEDSGPTRVHHVHLVVRNAEEVRDAAAAVAPSRGRALDHMGFRIDATLPAFADAIEATGYSPYLVRPNPPGSDLMFFEGPGGIHFEIAERGAR